MYGRMDAVCTGKLAYILMGLAGQDHVSRFGKHGFDIACSVCDYLGGTEKATCESSELPDAQRREGRQIELENAELTGESNDTN